MLPAGHYALGIPTEYTLSLMYYYNIQLSCSQLYARCDDRASGGARDDRPMIRARGSARARARARRQRHPDPRHEYNLASHITHLDRSGLSRSSRFSALRLRPLPMSDWHHSHITAINMFMLRRLLRRSAAPLAARLLFGLDV